MMEINMGAVNGKTVDESVKCVTAADARHGLGGRKSERHVSWT